MSLIRWRIASSPRTPRGSWKFIDRYFRRSGSWDWPSSISCGRCRCSRDWVMANCARSRGFSCRNSTVSATRFLPGARPGRRGLRRASRQDQHSIARERDADRAQLGDGKIFGELAFLDGAPRAAFAVATQPSILLVVKRDAFADLVRRESGLGMMVMRNLAQDLAAKLRGVNAC